jgi:glutathionylspermidine synthase
MTTPDWWVGSALEPAAYDVLVQRAALECNRWTMGFSGTPTLARYPVVVSRERYAVFAHLAEQLAAEALAAETELLTRPDLQRQLGLPPGAAALLAEATPSPAPRFQRVDFHPTAEGYRITESNADVAGGFIEGSGVAALWPNGEPAGDPARALAEAFVERFGRGATVGLLHLTRFTDDRQVVAYLARRFEEVGLRTVLFDASQLRAGLAVPQTRVDAVFRFVPGDWVEALDHETDWPQLFRSSVVSNPLSALLTQSKRFPLTWPQLLTDLPTWRAMTPEVARPEHATGWSDLVLKPAFGHEGFFVTMTGVASDEQRAAVAQHLEREPEAWVAQRRFTMLPTATPDGPRFLCVGIYVVNERACGAYARSSLTPVIDDHAQDVVVLLEDP